MITGGLLGNADWPEGIAMRYYEAQQYLAVIRLFPDSPLFNTNSGTWEQSPAQNFYIKMYFCENLK